jgi:hypothetical protein
VLVLVVFVFVVIIVVGVSWRHCVAHVARHWPVISRVALAPYERRRLTGDEVRQIANELPARVVRMLPAGWAQPGMARVDGRIL